MKSRIRISNTYNKEAKAFDKNSFDLKESDKAFSGRLTISSKKKVEGQEKWLNYQFAFIAWKDKLDLTSKTALLNHGGRLLDIDARLMVDEGQDGKPYPRFVINSVEAVEQKKPVVSYQEKRDEEEMPW